MHRGWVVAGALILAAVPSVPVAAAGVSLVLEKVQGTDGTGKWVRTGDVQRFRVRLNGMARGARVAVASSPVEALAEVACVPSPTRAAQRVMSPKAGAAVGRVGEAAAGASARALAVRALTVAGTSEPMSTLPGTRVCALGKASGAQEVDVTLTAPAGAEKVVLAAAARVRAPSGDGLTTMSKSAVSRVRGAAATSAGGTGATATAAGSAATVADSSGETETSPGQAPTLTREAATITGRAVRVPTKHRYGAQAHSGPLGEPSAAGTGAAGVDAQGRQSGPTTVRSGRTPRVAGGMVAGGVPEVAGGGGLRFPNAVPQETISGASQQALASAPEQARPRLPAQAQPGTAPQAQPGRIAQARSGGARGTRAGLARGARSGVARGAQPGGAAGTLPGMAGALPGAAGTLPGMAGTLPGMAGTSPGTAGMPPGVAGTLPEAVGVPPGGAVGALPGAVPGVQPGGAPAVQPGGAPAVQPGGVPGVQPEAGPQGLLGGVQPVVPGAPPQVLSLPEATAGAVPSTGEEAVRGIAPLPWEAAGRARPMRPVAWVSPLEGGKGFVLAAGGIGLLLGGLWAIGTVQRGRKGRKVL
ncbi:hypothetical protein [Nonomuraea jiangxiensis]|uniref:Uncharacterized protein n=1 Tax=Nonomuraea jiangxiensis TaxID=633440 RepID=A0A1G8NJF6_9ACTN|nr:hypothetical protein [Nonomuraea jiangxiensis]SDI80411.1 hypothetical protein SAMN05421869_107144 [Nonomuraea jiangxiensis]